MEAGRENGRRVFRVNKKNGERGERGGGDSRGWRSRKKDMDEKLEEDHEERLISNRPWEHI